MFFATAVLSTRLHTNAKWSLFLRPGSCGAHAQHLHGGGATTSEQWILFRRDLSSEWSKAHAVEVLCARAGLRRRFRSAPANPHWTVTKCCWPAHATNLNLKFVACRGVEVDDDPEVKLFFCRPLAYCGQTHAALRMLRLAIKRNYCSYPAMDKDPFFDKVRSNPEFSQHPRRGCRLS